MENVVPFETEKAMKATPVPSFQTYYKRVISEKDYEVNNLPSETIPDQSMSVQELVYRYTHGQMLSGSRTPIYEEEGDIQYPANWDKLDISERYQFFDEKRKEYEELSAKLQRDKNELVEKQRQEEIEKSVQEKLAAIRAARKGEELPPKEKPE